MHGRDNTDARRVLQAQVILMNGSPIRQGLQGMGFKPTLVFFPTAGIPLLQQSIGWSDGWIVAQNLPTLAISYVSFRQ